MGSEESRTSVREHVDAGSPAWLCIHALMVLGTSGGFFDEAIVAGISPGVGACSKRLGQFRKVGNT